MNLTPSKKPLPLDEVMLAMDVVDTLRHRSDLVLRELDGKNRQKQLLEKLREIYLAQGINVPDNILEEGVKALEKDRFIYEPPKGGFKVFLAKLYVSRTKWGKWFLGIITALFIGIFSYQFIYVPNQQAKIKAQEIEISQTLPSQMQAVYENITKEAKVQSAIKQANEILQQGLIASKENNKIKTKEALASLTNLRDLLRQEYSLRVVNKEGEKSGVWTFPEINTDATNYYLIVEAIDKNNQALTLPILNEETDKIENVNIWGIRVPENIYASVGNDKRDDGIIQNNMVGTKSFGYLKPSYSISVLDGAITRW